MERLRDRVAGLDVHRDSVVGCVRLEGDGHLTSEKARFSTTAAGLGELVAWLESHEVTTVVMEATGVYWKPVYYALEDLFEEVWLCNARHVKNVPGRKTDMSDAEWLADVAAHGMVRPSFVPPPPMRELRELTRYRKCQIDARTREIQRLEKLLQDAGIKLSSVASTVWSASAKEMVRALVKGERDPKVLAQMAKGKMRAKIAALEEALVPGRFQLHHGVVADQILDHIDFLDASIEALTAQIVERSDPFEAAASLLGDIPGFGSLVTQTFIAEAGTDMSRFPSAAHLASWAGLAPGNHESAGKRRVTGTPPGNQWLRRAMIEAARAAARCKGSYFAAQYANIARRRGPNKAAVAVAHSMIVVAWNLLTTGERYQDLGADYFQRRRDPELETRRLLSRLQALGHDVILNPAA